jgi:DNA-binding PadR family transcriptional regulator
MTNNYQKEIQTKLTKGLLDMIILQFLDQEPMHGYQLFTKVRKGFGVYFGPSTVYPLPRNTGKERLREKHLEHGFRKTPQGLLPDQRRRNSS